MEGTQFESDERHVSEARSRLEHRLQQIDARESTVRAFVPGTFDASRVRADFAAAAARDPEAPLLGWLLGVKDIFHVDGLPTRAGATIDPSEWAGPQASTVTALLDAGAVVAGKTITTELACWRSGPTTNPWRSGHTPGGSSSGSAASVGAGMVDVGFGSQTIGSIIRPAAYCGTVGWKPTRGRIPLDGMIPYSPSIDHVGFITPDLDALASLLPHVQAGWSPASAEPLRRLAVPAGPLLDRLTDGRSSFAAARSRIVESGIEIVEIDALADLEVLDRSLDRLTYAEAAAAHRLRMSLIRQHCDAALVAELDEAAEILDVELEALRDRGVQLANELDQALEAADAHAWLTPSTPGVAPPGLESTGDPAMNAVWTYAGLPALTIPWSVGEHRLPLGLQLIGRSGDDERIVAAASHLPPSE